MRLRRDVDGSTLVCIVRHEGSAVDVAGWISICRGESIISRDVDGSPVSGFVGFKNCVFDLEIS